MTRRWRHRFAIAALLALLLQQVAIAGHLCTASLATLAASTDVTQAVEPESMPCHAATEPSDEDSPAMQSDSGCRQHCDASHTLVDTGHSASVPMPPPALAWSPVLRTPDAATSSVATTPLDGEPPPRQRFCSLLI